jgi:hypothetical protein
MEERRRSRLLLRHYASASANGASNAIDTAGPHSNLYERIDAVAARNNHATVLPHEFALVGVLRERSRYPVTLRLVQLDSVNLPVRQKTFVNVAEGQINIEVRSQPDKDVPEEVFPFANLRDASAGVTVHRIWLVTLRSASAKIDDIAGYLACVIRHAGASGRRWTAEPIACVSVFRNNDGVKDCRIIFRRSGVACSVPRCFRHC